MLTTPRRVAAFTGAVFGLMMATFGRLATGSLTVAAIGGVLAGAGFGVVCALMSRQPLEALAGLSMADRKAVVRTVRKGRPVTDRRLALAVVSYAEALRRRRTGWTNAEGHAWVVVVLAAGQALGAVSAALDRDWWGVAIRSSVTVLFLLFPRLLRRERERLDAAERAARALLEQR